MNNFQLNPIVTNKLSMDCFHLQELALVMVLEVLKILVLIHKTPKLSKKQENIEYEIKSCTKHRYKCSKGSSYEKIPKERFLCIF